jgi:hypothetical protein
MSCAGWFFRRTNVARLRPCRAPYRRPHDRRGISLLEIMISIGVVGIGLIGVASLIPLAHYKASEGVREERKALFGRRVFREFLVNEFHRPGSWQGPNQGTPYWAVFNGQHPYQPVYNPLTGRVLLQTYCFDPHWVAARLAGSFPTSGTFPEVGPANLVVPRVTVLAYRPEVLRESLLLHGATPAVASLRAAGFVGSPTPMSLARADEIFRIHDDLIVEPPDNPNDIARQSYLSESSSAYPVPQAFKRLAHGGFSWMATLVPELNSAVDPSNPTVFLAYLTNRFKVSIVVFNQRNLTSNYAEEVVAQVAVPPNSLMTGAIKELVINELGQVPPVPENVGVRHIRGGDWVALVQKLPLPAPQPPYTRLLWYQVVSTDEQTSDTTMTRQLSLAGPDWNPDWSQPIYAIYLRNVEAVFEKSVEIQP